MTVTANQANRYSYSGDGTTKAFAYGSKFLANADLTVLLVDSAGVSTTQTITTDYTVTGAGDDTGGTVTFLTAPASGKSVVIFADPAIEQPVDLVDNDGFEADTVEGAFDRNALIARRLDDKVSRAFTFADSDTSGASTTMPSPSAGKFMRWNTAGTALETVTVEAGASVVSATEAAEGIAEIATQTEVNTGTDDTKFVTPKKLAGQIATQVEVDAGTNDTKIVTPKKLAANLQAALQVKTTVFTTSGTYTPTAGMVYAIVECCGGGGAGGGVAASNAAGGGGGGAGGYARKLLSASDVGASQTVTIGDGGTGVSGDAGGDGGDTSLGALVTAPGGTGGTKGSTGSVIGGGAGGVPTTGDINISGATGHTGQGHGTGDEYCFSGAGAPSIFGGGGVNLICRVSTQSSAGGGATAYGAGGGGAVNNTSASAFAGGNGKAGICIVTEFIATSA